MRVVKYVCDRCGRELGERFFSIVPEFLEAKNPELTPDDYLDDPVSFSQADKHYCRICTEKIIRYANSVPARVNPELEKAVKEMMGARV